MLSVAKFMKVGAAVCALAAPMATALAQTIYDNIPSTLAGNYASLGYQATSTREFGDRINFDGTSRALSTVTITMSSWARSEDYGGAATFTHPITLNIYQAGSGNLPGALIVSKTQTFTIPFRPTGYGFNGIASNIVFDFSTSNITLPNSVVYGVVYNTQSYGPAPIGAPGPYNSLNVGLNDAPGGGITVGSNDDLDDTMWNTSFAGFYTDGGAGGVGIFRRDTAWAPYVPMAQFDTATLSLNAANCVTDAGRTLTVTVNKSATGQNALGGQFFIQYDNSILTFVSAAPAGPFTTVVYSDTLTPGLIDYAVGVPFGGTGTAAASPMATLTFTANQDVCATASNLVTFRPHSPPSRITNSLAAPIAATLADLPSISIDTTAPSITCPPDVTVNADAGLCTASIGSTLGDEWFPFGDSQVVSKPGSPSELVMQMSSTAAGPNHYSGFAYDPAGTLLLSNVTQLSFDYAMTLGQFYGGSPRFQIGIDTTGDGYTDGNVFLYVGSFPNYQDSPPLNQWFSTGDLANTADARWDAGQFPGYGGAYGQTRSQVMSAVGSFPVTFISIVMDSSWFADQVILIDNFNVNGTTQTVGNPMASDNCTASPALSQVRSDGGLPSDPFPVGTTMVTWTATDDCGNATSCIQNVTVLNQNTMYAAVKLEGIDISSGTSPFTRCVTFTLPTAGCTTMVTKTMTFTDGLASTTVDIPCGSYDCISARDTLHTLRRTIDSDPSRFGIDGTVYYADFTGVDGDPLGKHLIGGNLNDDNVIDILDFGAFAGQYGQTLGASTNCSTPFPHSDISGDGAVLIEDYTYIQQHFLLFAEANCCGVVMPPPLPQISVEELINTGRGALAVADFNLDGMLDQQDMDIFGAHGGTPNCSADFNGDGDIGTDADIEAFFACLAGNCCYLCGSADFNGDGDIGTDADIESFFRVLAGGPC